MRLGSALRLVQTVVSIPLGLSTRAAAAAGVGAGAGPLAGSLHALTPLVQPHGEFVVAADGGKVLRGRLAGGCRAVQCQSHVHVLCRCRQACTWCHLMLLQRVVV